MVLPQFVQPVARILQIGGQLRRVLQLPAPASRWKGRQCLVSLGRQLLDPRSERLDLRPSSRKLFARAAKLGGGYPSLALELNNISGICTPGTVGLAIAAVNGLTCAYGCLFGNAVDTVPPWPYDCDLCTAWYFVGKPRSPRSKRIGGSDQRTRDQRPRNGTFAAVGSRRPWPIIAVLTGISLDLNGALMAFEQCCFDFRERRQCQTSSYVVAQSAVGNQFAYQP
ncbi:hypothetical protein [Rugosimonospora africana]|nr:hypothetical protein [Rugosimonospora africana]